MRNSKFKLFFFRSLLLYNIGFVLVLCIKIVIAFSFFLLSFCLIIAISVYLKLGNEEVSVVIYVQKSMKSAFVWNSIVFVICSYFLNCISTVFLLLSQLMYKVLRVSTALLTSIRDLFTPFYFCAA